MSHRRLGESFGCLLGILFGVSERLCWHVVVSGERSRIMLLSWNDLSGEGTVRARFGIGRCACRGRLGDLGISLEVVLVPADFTWLRFSEQEAHVQKRSQGGSLLENSMYSYFLTHDSRLWENKDSTFGLRVGRASARFGNCALCRRVLLKHFSVFSHHVYTLGPV